MKYYNKSVEGSSHKVSGLPCQDFSSCELFEINQQKAIIMAVSDGHGSRTYVRSHVGSMLACQVAIGETRQFVLENYSQLVEKGEKTIFYSPDFSYAQDLLISSLFESIHKKWYALIKNDSQENPFTKEEQLKLGTADIKQAYGCTLMVTVKTSDFVFSYHLGDGRIFSISNNNEWNQIVPWDSACEDNITTSLCEDNLVSRFRYYLNSGCIQPFAIFMCSDGIEDCYGGSHDGSFSSKKLEVDYSEVIRCFLQDEGFDRDCGLFLESQSKRLSHDDMSIAFLVDDRYGLLEKWLNLVEIQKNKFEINSKIESYLSDIKELNDRISHIESNVKYHEKEISALNTSIGNFKILLKELEKKQQNEEACAEIASRFNVRMSDYQTSINEYCESFITQSNGGDDKPVFRKSLTKYVKTAFDNALKTIRTEIETRRDSDTKLVKQIDKVQLDISTNEKKLEREIADKDESEAKLNKLKKNRDDLEEELSLFKQQNVSIISKYDEDVMKINEQISNVMPTTSDVSCSNDDSLNQEKRLNICRVTNKNPESDITITYTGNSIYGSWNGDKTFEIKDVDLNTLKEKIKESLECSNSSESMLESDCIAIMVPNEKCEIRYVPLSVKSVDELWQFCLSLNKDIPEI